MPGVCRASFLANHRTAARSRQFFVCIQFPMYLSVADSTLIQNTKSCVNVISEGSPSRSRMVLRISFGITTRPKSSILLTIPVAFILCLLFQFRYFGIALLFKATGIVCRRWGFIHQASFRIFPQHFTLHSIFPATKTIHHQSYLQEYLIWLH